MNVIFNYDLQTKLHVMKRRENQEQQQYRIYRRPHPSGRRRVVATAQREDRIDKPEGQRDQRNRW